jgi:hypothetical protein
MPLYVLPSQIPELKHLPSLEREDLVDAALFSVPLTPRSLLAFCGVILPFTAVGVALAFALGPWVAYFWLPLGAFVIWVVLLNLAQKRIRELARERHEEIGEA